MSTLGSLALSAGEVAFFAPPPRPPQRRAGREETRGIGRLIRVVRRELALATRTSPVDSVPPLRNYPY
jgi:hypothetical protein